MTRLRMTRVRVSAPPRRGPCHRKPFAFGCHRSAHCIAGRLGQPLLLPRDRPRCPEPEQAWLKQSRYTSMTRTQPIGLQGGNYYRLTRASGSMTGSSGTASRNLKPICGSSLISMNEAERERIADHVVPMLDAFLKGCPRQLPQNSPCRYDKSVHIPDSVRRPAERCLSQLADITTFLLDFYEKARSGPA